MEGRNPITWKAAALPLAAVTVALVVGARYFAGNSEPDSQAPAGQSAQFKFDSGPRYAPGTGPATRPAQPAGSSLDMFQKANENYSAETASSEEPVSRRPKTKAELREFMKQVHQDINMDPAARAAAEAEAAQAPGGGPGGRAAAGRTAAAGSQEQQAAVTALHSRQGAAGSAPKGSLNSKKNAFSAGRLGAGLSSGVGGRQNGSAGSRFGAAGSGGGETEFAQASGGEGRSLEAGAYGSHGGGGASSPQMAGAAGSPSGAAGGGGGGQTRQPEQPKEPAAFIWPRSFDFGDMYQYETASRQVIVMNIGDAPLKVGKIANMDTETPFSVEKDKCSSATLAPGKSCTFRVRFSPKAVRDYTTGFEVPSNDGGAMAYQGFVEVKGNSKYSYSTWWWYHNWSGTAGYHNRLNFGLVPEGYAMEEVLRITNTTGSKWEEIKLDTSRLPGSFKLSGDGCSGKDLAPRQSCAVTVTFVPTDAVNRKYSTDKYGQYHSVNLNSGAKLVHPRPKFPPLVLDTPVEAAPAGKLRVLAHFNIVRAGQVVLEVPVQATSSAAFPLVGLARVQHYYFFK